MKYKVGDKVIIQKRGNDWVYEMDEWINKVMTIKYVYDRGYEMEEDDNEWFWGEHTIKCLANNNQSIHIYVKGNETHALLKENKQRIKELIAKCSPEDEFSLYEGAKLALDRLLDEEQKEEKDKFKIGDTVKIINTGEIYSHYIDWFKKYNCVELGFYYRYDIHDKDIDTSKEYKIVKCGKSYDDMLYAIQSDDKYIYLIGEKGIKKNKKNYSKIPPNRC